MEQQIELITGIILFITGLSFIFNQKEWINFFKYAEEEGSWVVMMVGFNDLLFGGFIIAFHWIWTGIGIITSILGIILFVRGVMRILFPSQVVGQISSAKPIMVLCGISFIIISTLILYGYYMFITPPTPNLLFIYG